MSEPRGKMPGVLAGVTKIMVARYVAPCGHRFTSRSAAKSHEAAATCWKLPALKTCGGLEIVTEQLRKLRAKAIRGATPDELIAEAEREIEAAMEERTR